MDKKEEQKRTRFDSDETSCYDSIHNTFGRGYTSFDDTEHIQKDPAWIKMRSKKSQLKMIVNIALIILGFMIVVGIINQFFSQAEGKTAESICRGSVAARMRATVLEGGTDVSLKLFPLLCKTLDVIIPQKPIVENKEKELALTGIADYTSKAWWMFGEGAAESIFGVEAPGGKDDCLIAYIIKVEGIKDEVIRTVDIKEFLASTPYLIEEGSDGCMNFGGLCVEDEDTCTRKNQENDAAGWRFKEMNSVCEERYGDKKPGCCYSKYSCFNKGARCDVGRCRDDEIEVDISGWECPSLQSCCIDKEKTFNYIDYIQKYNYEGNVGIEESMEITDKDTVAITYITQGVKPFWPDDWFWTSGGEKINRILISSLDYVSGRCAVQKDIGGN